MSAILSGSGVPADGAAMEHQATGDGGGRRRPRRGSGL